MRTPAWRDIEEFCRKDGWKFVRSSDHTFYRKVLVDGTVLETHTSFAGDTMMSPGRFAAILRTQLQVTQEEFWETLRTGRQVKRPVPQLPLPPRALATWLVRVLINDLGLSETQIAELGEEEARRLVEEHWSRKRPAD